MEFLDQVHEMIFSGGLKKGGTWGGPDCTAAVSTSTNVMECSMWCAVIVGIYIWLGIPEVLRELVKKSEKLINQQDQRLFWRKVDFLFATIHGAMWLLVVYYKINLKSLVNLLQPCHLALLAEGVAAAWNGPYVTLVAMLTLPLLTGAVMALAFPATTGLDQPFEETSFFIQHYLLLVTPLYLLCRHNCAGAKLFTWRVLIVANWIQMVIHWSFFAVSIQQTYCLLC